MPVNAKMEILERLSQTHYLIHFHPNNCCGTTIYNNIIVPNVFECTYIRKDLQFNIGLNDIPIPHPLDKPNTPNNEIYINYYPFVN